MTAPLTPPDCDIRDYPGMMVDVARVRDSGLASDETPEACWAAFLLWCASWHQVPAGSIPDNDQWIAKHAGYAQRGRIDTKAWNKVRDGALRNFVKCSDGLLYHPVVAEKALEAWLTKLASRLSSGAGNAKRWKVPFDPAPIEAQMKVAKEMLTALNPQSNALTKRKHSGLLPKSDQDPAGTPVAIPSGSQEKEREGKGSSDSAPIGADGAGAPPAVGKKPAKTPEEIAKADLWRAAVSVLEQGGCPTAQCRTFMGKLVGDYTFPVVQKAVAAAVTVQPADAREYLVATCQRLKGERSDPVTVESDAAEKTQRYLAEQAEHAAEIERQRLARIAARQAAEGAPA